MWGSRTFTGRQQNVHYQSLHSTIPHWKVKLTWLHMSTGEPSMKNEEQHGICCPVAQLNSV